MTEPGRMSSSGKNLVYALSRPSRCYGCDRRLEVGEIVCLKSSDIDKEVFCRKCAGLDKLELVGKGNQKITRLACKYSQSSFVVMQWSELWKCYERVGILAESAAIDKAEAEAGAKLPARNSMNR